MARHAKPDTPPVFQPDMGSGVHAGPAPFPVQTPASPGKMPAPQPVRRPLRDRLHRNRNQVKPWRFLFLAPAALAVKGVLHVVPFGEYLIPAALIALAVIVGGTQWKRQARREFRAYAATCAGYAGAWMLYATEFGFWGTLGRWSPALFMAGWLPLSWLWWERHRTRIASPRDDTGKVEQNPFVSAWRDNVEPELHWKISHLEEVAVGDRYRIQLVPGQAIEDAQEKRRKVASLLRIHRNRLTFEPLPGDEPGDSGDESVVSLIVTKTQNPHNEAQTWQGPTLNETTGLYKHGVYPDAAAFMRLFKVENGIPHRACNGLWSGTTGSGKSRGLAVKIAEHVLSSMFCVWYADGKEGASASELDGNVDWYVTSKAECERMLRAAWKVMKVRARIIKQLNQARFEGKQVLYMGALGFPMLQIVLDEAQEFLSSKIMAKLVKALLRMGNEVGIGMDLATQVPLLNELGAEAGDGGAEVIRSMAKSGNLGVYRAEDGFTGTVTVSNDLKVDPKALPKEPGWCFLAGHSTRGAKCKSFYVSKDALYALLHDAPVITLDEASARAAGEDYATRHKRAKDADIPPEEVDLHDLDDELGILLGERLPGQMDEGQAADELTVKQAVFNAVKDHGGPMKREEVIAAVAAQGKQASESSINQQLKWWCERSHMHKTGHGFYDLINRESAEPEPTGV
jgi:hypothetical protein